MLYASEGWPNKYKPSSVERRANAGYVAHMNAYTATSRAVGNIRSEIVVIANEAGVEPPLDRREVRLGTRDDEIVQALGEAGMTLLGSHQAAAQANFIALTNLREQAILLSRSR